MHNYEPRWGELDLDEVPGITSFRFEEADDVATWASFNCSMAGHAPRIDAWHLDNEGAFACWTRGGTTTLKEWAKDPWPLLRSRRVGLREGGCADRWVMVESRPTWLHPAPTLTEADAEAFVRLRSRLERVGVSLLDAVVFDDLQHWWSLHELITGSTRWARARVLNAPPARQPP